MGGLPTEALGAGDGWALLQGGGGVGADGRGEAGVVRGGRAGADAPVAHCCPRKILIIACNR